MATACTRTPDFRTGCECPVCFDSFDILESTKTPRKLSCDHIFCHECLESIIDDYHNRICCPLCRTYTEVHFRDLSQLPVHTFPSLEDADLDASCQHLILSLYEEIEDYKKKESVLEDKLKEAAVQARQREDKLIKELEQCKMLAERMKVFKREVLRIDINKATLTKEIADLKEEIEAIKGEKDYADDRCRELEAMIDQTQGELIDRNREIKNMRESHERETRQLKRNKQDNDEYHNRCHREHERQIMQLKKEKEDDKEYFNRRQREHERQTMQLKRDKEENEIYHNGIQKELNSKLEVLQYICVFLVVLVVISVIAGVFIYFQRKS